MRVPDNLSLREWILDLIVQGALYKFYKTSDWLDLRASVMHDHHHECERCESLGKYSKADTLHHEFEVKRYPHMALTRYVTDYDGSVREVLHPLCNDCHNIVHGRKINGSKKKKPVTDEWW